MNNGAMFIGAGEVSRDGLQAVSADDIARNRQTGILPRFFTRHEKCVDNSYREVEYLELLIPGDAKSSPVHLVDDRLRDRYRAHYQAFKENKELPEEGTPVEAWLNGNEGLVLHLKSLHLKTVESVAGMSDQTCQTFGLGGRDLRAKAQKFLETQSTAISANAVMEKDERIRELEARLAKLENGGEEVEEERNLEAEETKIEVKKHGKPNQKLFVVMIDGVQDGDPMSEAKAEARAAELREENNRK